MVTPGRGVLLSMGDPGAIPTLVDDLARRRPNLEAVDGHPDLARAFAARWQASTGRRPTTVIHECLYRLTRLREPARPAAGSRPSRRSPGPRPHRGLARPVLGRGATRRARAGHPVDGRAMARRPHPASGALGARRPARLDGGRRVADPQRDPNRPRLHPARRPRPRDIGSAVTAAATRAQLDAGRSACYLYADLANLTANRVYRALGYEPVIDVDRLRFGPPPGDRVAPQATGATPASPALLEQPRGRRGRVVGVVEADGAEAGRCLARGHVDRRPAGRACSPSLPRSRSSSRDPP